MSVPVDTVLLYVCIHPEVSVFDPERCGVINADVLRRAFGSVVDSTTRRDSICSQSFSTLHSVSPNVSALSHRLTVYRVSLSLSNRWAFPLPAACLTLSDTLSACLCGGERSR